MMSTAIPILIATVNILWLVSPPVLTVLALQSWNRKRRGEGLRLELPLALGTVLLADWVLFIRFLIHSATPYGMYFHTSWATASLLILSLLAAIASVAVPMGRWQMVLASVLTLSLWVGVGYALRII